MKKILKIIFFVLPFFFISNISAQEELPTEPCPICEVCPICKECQICEEVPISPLTQCNDPELEQIAEQLPCSFIPPIDETEVPIKGSEIVELPVNGFTNSLTGWTKIGTSPYLDAIDYALNYIQTNITSSTGYYDFSDLFLGGTIEKVELMFYCGWTAEPSINYGQFYVRNSSTFVSIGTDNCPFASWGWVVYDITDTENLSLWNLTTINNTQIYATFTKIFGTENLRIDSAKLRITYLPEELPEYVEHQENISTGAGFYLDKRISYGDIFLMIIISIILIYTITEKIGKFVFKK